MNKVGLIALTLGFFGIIASVSLTPEADAGKPCARTTFETSLVGDACKKGGQGEAKKVMKAWMKKAKKQDKSLDCKSCHSKLAPSYALKDDALAKYKQLGGK